jgi:hypothetical protein
MGQREVRRRVKAGGKQVRAWAEDYPMLVNLGAGVLLGLYWLATRWWPEGSIPRALGRTVKSEVLLALALGAAGVATMTAGFAGVVIIFGLSGGGPRFRKLRQAGGQRLLANWVSVVAVSFTAAFLAVAVGVAALADWRQEAVWGFLFVCLLAAHGAARLVWLLTALAQVVKRTDKDEQIEEDAVHIDDILRRTA